MRRDVVNAVLEDEGAACHHQQERQEQAGDRRLHDFTGGVGGAIGVAAFGSSSWSGAPWMI